MNNKIDNIREGYKGIDVEIISYTKHPAKIMWDMLKQTWISLHDVEYTTDKNSEDYELIKKYLVDSLERRLNPVPQEAILIQVVFKGISRVNLAQVTRQRGWFFNSESQMPQKVNHNVILPLNIANSEYRERAEKLIKESRELYDDMVKGNESRETTNIPYQDARYLLLNGQTTDISASFTLPLLASAAGMRLENNTHDEINYTFRILINRLKKAIESDSEMDEFDKMIYLKVLNNCDTFGANRKVCVCCDAMFGNSFKRYKDANEDVTKATENCLFDYKKLAWYSELKRMRKEEPELLLKDEEEMIGSWED